MPAAEPAASPRSSGEALARDPQAAPAAGREVASPDAAHASAATRGHAVTKPWRDRTYA